MIEVFLHEIMKLTFNENMLSSHVYAKKTIVIKSFLRILEM